LRQGLDSIRPQVQSTQVTQTGNDVTAQLAHPVPAQSQLLESVERVGGKPQTPVDQKIVLQAESD